MKLLAKKIVIVGGNGYVGNFFGSRLVRQSAHVVAISRKGPKYDHPQNKNITWVQGNIMSPQPILEYLNNAEIIIHTLGALVDTHVRKGTPKGGDGTYEQVNRDSFASLLNSLDNKKKVIYLSSNYHPPFLQRYLTTKHQAENLLFNSVHQGYSLRPGFIYNWDHRKWSVPLKHGISIWNKIYPTLESLTSPTTTLQNVVKQFKQGQSTDLQQMGDAMIMLCESGHTKNIIENKDIHELSLQYRKSKGK